MRRSSSYYYSYFSLLGIRLIIRDVRDTGCTDVRETTEGGGQSDEPREVIQRLSGCTGKMVHKILVPLDARPDLSVYEYYQSLSEMRYRSGESLYGRHLAETLAVVDRIYISNSSSTQVLRQ